MTLLLLILSVVVTVTGLGIHWWLGKQVDMCSSFLFVVLLGLLCLWVWERLKKEKKS